MIVSARKAVAFLEKHAHRVTDPIVRPSPEEVARLRREARLLLFGATTVERPLLWRFLAACDRSYRRHQSPPSFWRGWRPTSSSWGAASAAS